jgi:hypothetical protein
MSIILDGTTGITTPDLTDSSLTSGRVVYAGASGNLTGASGLTFDGTNLETTGRLILRTNASPFAAGQFGYSSSGGNYIWAKAGTTGSQDNFFIFDDGGNPAYSINSSRSHIWSVSGSEGMRLTSTGLGIGTSSPNFKTEIVGGANTVETTLLQLSANAGGTGTGSTIAFCNSTNPTAGSGRVELAGIRDTANGGSFVIRTGDSSGTIQNRVKIDEGGNLLVGKTSSSDTVVGSMIRGSGYITSTWAESTDATTTYHVYSTGAGAYRFYVGLGGTINATSTTITAISDQRLKENIRNIDTGLDSIMALKPRRFDWKEGKGQDKKDVAGFIAQEFEDVFPECVSTSKAGADGIEYKNINHETLIPTLVKAMQEQQALITQLQADIATLKG